MMQIIYVISASGKPLMPTIRQGHVRRLLNTGKARITSHVPFTIQLKYNTSEIVQPLHGGTDPGRTNIGEAVISDDGDVVLKTHITSRNKDVPKLMSDRRAHRQASRRGERLARKRLAKRYGTTTIFPSGRILGGCDEPMMLKDIINTEARFNNRKRPAGWITPTVRQLVQTHVKVIKQIRKFLPVNDWTLEINKFAFMRMDDGTVYGADFQNGRMKGYPDAKSYIYALQNGKCAICGQPIEHYHHICPRSRGGSNTPENILGFCKHCHEGVHLGHIDLEEIGLKKKYNALSVLNQAIPYIYKELTDLFGENNVHICFGHQTKEFRDKNKIAKEHENDASCIAAIGAGISDIHDNISTYEIKQFRRHDRSIIKAQRERTYYLDGKAVCKNRHKRFEQKDDSLEEFRVQHPEDVCRLTVKKSTRYYNNLNRILPGAAFLYQGERYVLSGQLSHGVQYRAINQGTKNFSASKCTIVKPNKGLVWL